MQGKDAKIIRLAPNHLEGIDLEPDSDLEDANMPEPSSYLAAVQRDGNPLGADEIFRDTWRWLREQGCEKLVSPRLIEAYAQNFVRFIQCEEAISSFGLLGKHPDHRRGNREPFCGDVPFVFQAGEYVVVRDF